MVYSLYRKHLFQILSSRNLEITLVKPVKEKGRGVRIERLLWFWKIRLSQDRPLFWFETTITLFRTHLFWSRQQQILRNVSNLIQTAPTSPGTRWFHPGQQQTPLESAILDRNSTYLLWNASNLIRTAATSLGVRWNCPNSNISTMDSKEVLLPNTFGQPPQTPGYQ